MIIDNTAGFKFLFSEDIYLVKSDIENLGAVIKGPAMTMAEPMVVAEQPPIIVTPEPITVIKTPVSRFDYIGKNRKHFLILCSYTDAIDDKHLAALTSTLQRKELSLDDVAILNIAGYVEATIHQLNEYFSPQRLLILGSASLLPGWNNFGLNQLEGLAGIKALYTYGFTEMMGDRDKTKAFWEQMKAL